MEPIVVSKRNQLCKATAGNDSFSSNLKDHAVWVDEIKYVDIEGHSKRVMPCTACTRRYQELTRTVGHYLKVALILTSQLILFFLVKL